jgi:hypothetical protein
MTCSQDPAGSMSVPRAGQAGDVPGDGGRPLVVMRTGGGAVSVVGVMAAVDAAVDAGEEPGLVPQPAVKSAARAARAHAIGLVRLSIGQTREMLNSPTEAPSHN